MMEYMNVSVTPARVTLESTRLEKALAEIKKGDKIGKEAAFECLYNGSAVSFTVKEYDEEDNVLLEESLSVRNLPVQGYLLRGTLSFRKDHRICVACKEPVVKTLFVNSYTYEE